MPVFLRIGVGLVLLGAAAITGGVMLGRSLSDTTGKQLVEGEVVRLRSHGNGRGQAPVVRYRIDGVDYEYASNTYSWPPAWSVGDRVQISCRPGSPDRGRIHSFGENWFWPIILMIAGGIAGTIGVTFCWFSIADRLSRRRLTSQTDRELNVLLESGR